MRTVRKRMLKGGLKDKKTDMENEKEREKRQRPDLSTVRSVT